MHSEDWVRAEARGSHRSLWPILITLSDMEHRRGHPAKAETLRKQAREIVDYIARHIETPALRTSFLDLPPVKTSFST